MILPLLNKASKFRPLVKMIQKQCSDRINILTYHNVENSPNFILDPLYVTFSVTSFMDQIEYFQKNMKIVGLRNLVFENAKLEGNVVVLTFDDGYNSFYKNVYPFLAENNLPVTLFVSPNFVNNTKVHLSHLFNYLLSCNDSSRVLKIFESKFEKKLSVSEIREFISNKITKYQYDIIKTDLLDEFGINEESLAKDIDLYVSSSQIHEMVANGVEIGNHSLNHYVLSRLDIGEQRYEIFESKRLINEMISQKDIPFAFPYGRKKHFKQETIELVKESSHYCALTLGSNLKVPINDFELSRLLMNPQLSITANLLIYPYFKDWKNKLII